MPTTGGSAMDEMQKVLGNWQLDVKAVRERMYGAPTALLALLIG